MVMVQIFTFIDDDDDDGTCNDSNNDPHLPALFLSFPLCCALNSKMHSLLRLSNSFLHKNCTLEMTLDSFLLLLLNLNFASVSFSSVLNLYCTDLSYESLI